MTDTRRTYYDHEPAYRRILQAGGRGWDDLNGMASASGSYCALKSFLRSEWFCSLPRPVHVLDLGCGGGQATLLLARHGCRAHGVDFSESAIVLARGNAADASVDAIFVVDDALVLRGFGAEQFDLVIDNHMLHCILGDRDRRAVLGSACRVLRSGGLLFSETMSAEGTMDMDALGVDPETRQNADRTRFWTTLGELRDLFETSALTILAQERRPQTDVPAPGETIITIARKEVQRH
ncbi:MAG: class I SAM-dependent methyltransferase [Phycisphaeraceae bacterium]|nr:class I SAM-dependent methyltransferase [Phycisphaeraceae bacterium]